jgi:hypothetical protein
MNRLSIIVRCSALASALVAALSLAACTKTSAPGTNPKDMTAQGHRDACEKHKAESAAYNRRAQNLNGGRGTYTAATESAEHADVAKQHGEAAAQVDPSVNDCK